MRNKNDTKRIPKLRFPEFRDAGEWEKKSLGDVAPLQRGFDLPSDQIEPGNIPVVYSNGIQNFHSKGMAKGPGLVTGRSGTIGKIHFIEEGDYWPHNTSLWVTSFKGNFPKFIYYLYISIGISRFSSGSGVPTLNRNDVHAFHTYIPSALPEQQKIADCLASLDDLIAAHARRLDALQTYKKGLMQQLFPAAGETAPRLRFPEFRDAGEWEKKKLGQILMSISNGLSLEQVNDITGYRVTRIETISDQTIDLNKVGYIKTEQDISSYKLNIGDILLSNINSLSHIGKTVIIDQDYDLYHGMNLLRLVVNESYCHPKFTFYLLNTETVKSSFIARANKAVNQASINQTELGKTIVTLPLWNEQQKIAHCLSSIDDLIAAQARKLEALKAHKKGLMQQLFPSMNEVHE